MKTISLTRGKVTIVDDEDYERFSKRKCFAHFDGVNWYALTSFKKHEGHHKKTDSLHRLILGLTDPKIRSDHKNRDTLDNRRCNLRVATPSQNNANKPAAGKSKYMGVSQFHAKTSTGKWRARISCKDVHYYLGQFDTEEAAARAYDAKAKELHGEFANYNFPDEL